jgi:hypothetical protein
MQITIITTCILINDHLKFTNYLLVQQERFYSLVVEQFALNNWHIALL